MLHPLHLPDVHRMVAFIAACGIALATGESLAALMHSYRDHGVHSAAPHQPHTHEQPVAMAPKIRIRAGVHRKRKRVTL